MLTKIESFLMRVNVMNKFKASCYCGNVGFSFFLPVEKVVQCHCRSCRKMQGSDYSTWIAVADEQFSIDAGSEWISNYDLNHQSSKSFCSNCGTSLYGVNGKHFKKHTIIPMGIVENYSSSIKPQIQVYTNNKAEWVELHKEVPIFG